jgi:hypothetical protein
MVNYLLGIIVGFSILFFIADVMTGDKLYTFIYAAILIIASFISGVAFKEARK